MLDLHFSEPPSLCLPDHLLPTQETQYSLGDVEGGGVIVLGMELQQDSRVGMRSPAVSWPALGRHSC